MDQKKVDACISKMRTLKSTEIASCIYQWVLTKHIRLDEFTSLLEWVRARPEEKPTEEAVTPAA